MNHAKKLAALTLAAALLFSTGLLAGRIITETPDHGDSRRRRQSADVPVSDTLSRALQWQLLLVNSDHPIPEDYAVALALVEGYKVDARIADALKEMLAAAQAESLSPVICSGYRSLSKQAELYEKKVRQFRAAGHSNAEAQRLAAQIVAVPGTSEHHTGLAVDIVSASYQALDGAQADTAETRWLHENAHSYGFILRYPADKVDVTGVSYEPWHYRYVGAEAAADIRQRGLCLEEYWELDR